ncbi:MAG: 50S ribosomal protein L29 [Ruminobacter sp.]|jgi:large subunit ribosomal protein L29|nr:50S ribosomal protein L29 [Ruminobacter sp.]
MFAKELNEKSVEELNTTLADLMRKQFGLKLSLKTGATKDTSELKKTRRDIARVKFVLAQKSSKKDGE